MCREPCVLNQTVHGCPVSEAALRSIAFGETLANVRVVVLVPWLFHKNTIESVKDPLPRDHLAVAFS